MKKILKKPCKLTLEEEYAFEHKQRIKAEAYIEEIWEFNQELTNEVLRLQKLVNEGKYAEKQTLPSKAKNTLKLRLKKIFQDRNVAIKKMEKRFK